MPPDRPPETDAEFRVVRGPWPRWALHLGLIKLIAWGVMVSAIVIGGFIGLVMLAGVIH